MPRGKFTNHKGRHRRFTNPDELEEERKREERKKEWRKNRGDESSEEEDEEGGASKKINESDESESGSEESDSDEGAESKAKGVEKLIEISNPNRVQNKAKKVSKLTLEEGGKPELSRKEREELERQQEAARYAKLHAEGKTQQAQADLARLAIIKQQREEAAKKREAEKTQKETEAKERAAARNKALGKKS